MALTRTQVLRHVQAHRGPSAIAGAAVLLGLGCGLVAVVLGVAVAAGYAL